MEASAKDMSYKTYIDMPKALPFEEAIRLYDEMLAEIGADGKAMEIYSEICERASRYSVFRSRWLLMSKEEKADTDPSRTACHDSMIICLNKLARYLRMKGKAAAWRDELGDEAEDPYIRKRIGDFGCYIALINGLNAR